MSGPAVNKGSSGGSTGPSGLFRFLFVETTFGSLLGILIVVAGLFSYQAMVKESSPDLAIPMAMVRTAWPGAAPELVEKQVTTPIEKAIKSMDRLKSITSGSRTGESVMLVEFEANAPVEQSLQSLRTKVSEAAGLLPEDAGAPAVEQVSTTDTPVMTYMLAGDVSDAELGEIARAVQERLERLPNVRKVEISGAREAIVRVLVDPMRLNAYDLTLSSVNNSIAQSAVDRPLGEIADGPLAASMSLAGRFTNINEIRALPIPTDQTGYAVKLSDIAEVRPDLSTASVKTYVSFNGADFRPGVSITLYKSPGSDTITLTNNIRAAVDAYPLPEGVNATVLSDDSIEVTNKLNTVFANAGEAVVAVVVVLLLMLSWREALIAGAAVPVTFLAAIAVAFAMDMTMNQMVVVGMVLALGLLVDVFILVMEGMHQALYVERRSFAGAVKQTVRKYALPAFAGQLTTILALAPLLFLGGTSGKFIRIVPLTAIICLVASYAIAFLWALPMSRLLLGSGPKEEKISLVDRVTQSAGTVVAGVLKKLVLRNKLVAGVWIMGSIGLVFFALMLASTLPQEMYPKEDGRNMGITVELPAGTPLDRSAELGKTIGAVLRGKDYIDNIILYAGQRSPYATGAPSDQITDSPGSHIIGFSVTFTTLEARNGKLAYSYVPELRQELNGVLGMIPGATMVVAAQTGGPSGGDDLRFEVSGEDLAVLRQAAEEVAQLVASVGGTEDVRTDLGPPQLQLAASPRREALQYFDINLASLAEEMSLGMGETTVAEIKSPGIKDDVPVVMGMAWPSRDGQPGPPKTWLEIAQIKIKGNKGDTVDATKLFLAQPGGLPQVIVHVNGTRTVTVLGKAANVNTGVVMQTVMPQLPSIEAKYPGITIGLAGQAQEAADTGAQMLQLFGITFFLMFAVLVLLFNSYLLPLIILFTVPIALVGTFGGFAAISMPISFPAMVGIVSLLGIVVNVAIVMVETMREYLRAGHSLQEAAAHGAADRLRPILSTTLTTVAGLVLLSFSSPMWQPLCYAIIFGLLATTVLSVVVIPALFLLLTTKSTAAKLAADRRGDGGDADGATPMPAPAE
ncbi:MAG: efflux RND transporter permease subunit [Rhodospirillaceae bacterium]